MTSKEALETLGNVKVEVSTIRSGRTFVKTLKEEYEKEFEVLGKELLFVRDIKPFDVYEEQYKKLEKALEILKEKLDIKIEFNHSGGYSLNHKVIHNCINSNERCIRYLEVEEADLLEGVFKWIAKKR